MIARYFVMWSASDSFRDRWNAFLLGAFGGAVLWSAILCAVEAWL